jgi:hypothetical protein
MDAQEREARIGQGVDEPVDQAAGIRREGVVVAPERHDPLPARVPGHRRHAVGVESGAGDDVAAQEVPLVGGEDLVDAALGDRRDRPSRVDPAATGADLIGDRQGDPPEVDDSAGRAP